jgi:mono/diheme cytochrome c family protein
LYQSLKYVPGGLGSFTGVVLPGVGLLILILLPWLKRARLIGATLLGVCVLLVAGLTTAQYLNDRRDPATWKQLSRQAAQEQALRNEPFQAASLGAGVTAGETASTEGGPPGLYTKFCAQCHGSNGQGARQGTINFPPLLDVPIKPHRTVDDIVGLLKDPTAYGLQPPMRSFSDKLSEPQMREIAEWIVKLKR